MKNGKYLDSLSSDKKSRILKNIATHYGISVADAEDEVRDDDAEMLYEYIANDNSLRMEVYNDMEKGKYAKGGGISKSTKYVPNRDIKSLMVVLQGELKSLKGTDIVDGVYVKTGRSSATKNSSNDTNAIIEKLKKIYSNSKVLKASKGDFKHVNHAYIELLLTLKFKQSNKNLFIVLPNLYDAQKYYDSLSLTLGDENVLFFPTDQILVIDR